MSPDVERARSVKTRGQRRLVQRALEGFYASVLREGAPSHLRDWFEHASRMKQLPTPNLLAATVTWHV